MLLPNEARYSTEVLKKLPLETLKTIIEEDSVRLEELLKEKASLKKAHHQNTLNHDNVHPSVILVNCSVITACDIFQKEHLRNLAILNERLSALDQSEQIGCN
ncbi:MAG: hypothetical protein K0U37_06440 [Gammaproteobacteria bacterium]|nr:hypothetical protein [Gammaproteobacteria bacterium]